MGASSVTDGTGVGQLVVEGGWAGVQCKTSLRARAAPARRAPRASPAAARACPSGRAQAAAPPSAIRASSVRTPAVHDARVAHHGAGSWATGGWQR